MATKRTPPRSMLSRSRTESDALTKGTVVRCRRVCLPMRRKAERRAAIKLHDAWVRAGRPPLPQDWRWW